MIPKSLPRGLKFQSKVLLPVMSIMVLLIVVPMWAVNHRMAHQLEVNAAERLTTADAVFLNLRTLRAKNLSLRFGNLPNEPRFRAILQHPDPKTVAGLLKDFLEELGGDAAVFSNERGSPLARFSPDPRLDLNEFSSRSSTVIDQAAGKTLAMATISMNGRLYDVVAVPVTMQNDVLGVLAFALELGNAAVQEFKQITRSEVILLSEGRIAATTLPMSGLPANLGGTETAEGAIDQMRPKHPARAADSVIINGEHFMSLSRSLNDQVPAARLHYALLSSYEQPWRILQATQRSFLWMQLAGIVFGGGLVLFLIRRVTHPLRELRDNAEAVGRGDFSRRAVVQSNDEIGELAAVFNQMTSNLKMSREELQRTVDTLRSTQAQLVQSEKLRAIGTLAGGIAHDFNNILSAILGFTELALDDVPSDSRTARNLQQVAKAGGRAKDLVLQILAFSRQSEPQRIPVRLSAIADETLKLLRATIPSTVTFKSEMRSEGDTVIADPSQMHQVLMNLATNASHAMKESGGTLTVAIEDYLAKAEAGVDTAHLTGGPYLRLTVSDTGHGMTREVQERIFEPFFTTKPIGEGTGLGLSVVHGIIKNHGGEISVASAPGAGTTFSILLPRVGITAPMSSVIPKPTTGHSERILIVDDEEPLVNLMQQKLTRLGYEVVAHSDSLAALRAFQAAPETFQIVITDQTMPHLTGEDLARQIASLSPGTPIIVCSGSGSQRSPLDDLDRFVRHYVPKPIDFVELSRNIRQLLENTPDRAVEAFVDPASLPIL